MPQSIVVVVAHTVHTAIDGDWTMGGGGTPLKRADEVESLGDGVESAAQRRAAAALLAAEQREARLRGVYSRVMEWRRTRRSNPIQ
jgi:hypothetical protein